MREVKDDILDSDIIHTNKQVRPKVVEYQRFNIKLEKDSLYVMKIENELGHLRNRLPSFNSLNHESLNKFNSMRDVVKELLVNH
jgi:hypothetical protein